MYVYALLLLSSLGLVLSLVICPCPCACDLHTGLCAGGLSGRLVAKRPKVDDNLHTHAPPSVQNATHCTNLPAKRRADPGSSPPSETFGHHPHGRPRGPGWRSVCIPPASCSRPLPHTRGPSTAAAPQRRSLGIGMVQRPKGKDNARTQHAQERWCGPRVMGATRVRKHLLVRRILVFSPVCARIRDASTVSHRHLWACLAHTWE
jgi:hypothetical protein